MEFQRYTDPWLHYSIPNFLSDDMFKIVEDTANTILDFKTQNHRSLVNYKNHDINFNKFFQDLYPIFCEKLEVESYLPVNILFQYVCYKDCDDDPRYGIGIHSDSFDKQLSCLIPLSSTGSGTLLYDENKNFVKETEWHKNAAFLFANKPTYYHSVGKSIKTVRCLLNVIYMPKEYSSIHEKLYNVKRPKKVR